VRRSPLLLAALALLAGCGESGGEDTPSACLRGADSYLRALEAAPAEVRLAGDAAISDCFAEGQEGGEAGTVGEAVIEAATVLNADARRDTVRLGYLVGAVQQGAASGGGTHADLVRRLDAAARFFPGGQSPGAAFERAFGRGYAAGQASG
jgi:hypothetical protein